MTDTILNEVAPVVRPILNKDEASRFLDALVGGPSHARKFIFGAYDDSPARLKSLAAQRFLTLDDAWYWIKQKQGAGCGIFVTINEMRGEQRSNEDFAAARAIWQDDDDWKALPAPMPLEPHIVVETSPGKWHQYLLTSTTDKDAWTAAQLAMVEAWGSDHNAKDPARVLRLPGTLHLKNFDGPWVVRIASINARPRYTLDEIVGAQRAAPSFVTEPVKPAPRAIAAPRDDLERAVALANVTDETMADLRQVLAAMPSDDRAQWISFGMALKATEHADAFEIWRAWSAKSPKFDADEAHARWEGFGPTTITHASIFKAAADAGVPNPKSKVDAIALEPHLAHLRPRYALSSWEEIQRRPPLRWVIRDTLPEGITMIYGPPASGKSFIVLDMALAIARGVDWQGKSTEGGTVVYIAAEGAAGVKARISAYLQHHASDNPGRFYDITDAPNLLAPASVNELGDAIDVTVKCDLLIVDTLHASSAGAEENSAKDQGIVSNHCKALRRRLGCSVLVVHHTGKDLGRGARGSNSWQGGVDAELFVEKGDVEYAGTLHNPKMKDGPTFASLGFQLTSHEVGIDDKGFSITSCGVDWTGRVSSKPAVKLGKNERIVLDVIQWRIDEFGHAVEKEVIAFAMERLPLKEGTRDMRRYAVGSSIATLREKGVIAQGDQEFLLK